MLAIKLITAKIRNTNNNVLPISSDNPPTLLAPNKIDTKPKTKNAIAALNIIFLLVTFKDVPKGYGIYCANSMLLEK